MCHLGKTDKLKGMLRWYEYDIAELHTLCICIYVIESVYYLNRYNSSCTNTFEKVFAIFVPVKEIG